MDVTQLREHIIKPSIMMLGEKSDALVNLLLGTAAQESHLGEWIVQQGLGLNGGIGIYQMEAATYHYTYTKHVEKSVAMKAKFRLFFGYEGKPQAARLASDTLLATVMARLYYSNFPEPLPDANDVKALAYYWKKYWNTDLGKGYPEQFMKNYNKYVLKI